LKREIGLSIQEIDNLRPFEIDIFEMLWVIDEKKKQQARKQRERTR